MKSIYKVLEVMRSIATQSCRLCAIAIVAVIGFSMAACDDGGGPSGGTPQTVTYSGYSGSDAYTLEITENLNRSAYSPTGGDNYTLILVSPYKISTGTIQVSGNTVTLIPNNGSSSITVTVSGTGMVSMTGAGFLWNDNSAFTAPGTLTPGNPPGGDGGLDWPSDAILSQVGLGGLSNPGVTDLNWTFHPDDGHGASIDIYFGGNINTKNNILSYLDNKTWTETYIDDLYPNNVKYHYWTTDGNGNGDNIAFFWSDWGNGVYGGEIHAVHNYGW